MLKYLESYNAIDIVKAVQQGEWKELRRAGAGAGLQTLVCADKVINAATLGAWEAVMTGMDDVAHDAATAARRSTRFVTGNQRWGQNTGDALYSRIWVINPNSGLKMQRGVIFNSRFVGF